MWHTEERGATATVAGPASGLWGWVNPVGVHVGSGRPRAQFWTQSCDCDKLVVCMKLELCMRNDPETQLGRCHVTCLNPGEW